MISLLTNTIANHKFYGWL